MDYVLSSFIGTPYRNQIGDLPTYWFAGPFGFIVPYPSKTIDIKSTIKIFTFEVGEVLNLSGKIHFEFENYLGVGLGGDFRLDSRHVTLFSFGIHEHICTFAKRKCPSSSTENESEC